MGCLRWGFGIFLISVGLFALAGVAAGLMGPDIVVLVVSIAALGGAWRGMTWLQDTEPGDAGYFDPRDY